jgi:ATP-dependent DNA helicase RecG
VTDHTAAETAKRIITLEKQRGYDDMAVTCGLEEFIRLNLPYALPAVLGYAAQNHFARRQAIIALEDLLEGRSVPSPNPALIDLHSPISQADGVGDKRAVILAKLSLFTLEDLLTYLPRRLEDRTQWRKIAALRQGDEVCLRGKILTIDRLRIRRGMEVIKVMINDGTGTLAAVWFNQPWITQQLKEGETIDLFGKIERNYREWQIKSPVWEPAGAGIETGRLVPIYPVTAGITSRAIFYLIRRNLKLYSQAISELLPIRIQRKYNLLSRSQAIEQIHLPTDRESFEAARRSLAFEELFLLQVGLAQSEGEQIGRAHKSNGKLAAAFLSSLPFQLTASQRDVLAEIIADLGSDKRMVRLLQGDVGAGKTVVALTAALQVIEGGFQVAIMVPTEILAEQHFFLFKQQLKDLPVTIALLTSNQRDKERLKERLAAGEIDLVVGTHALIQEDVTFAALGFVIIDEQHRFGVVQRALLEEKGENIDLLVMSATPIPRTIILTLYGQFDISTIEGMPLGKKRILTTWATASHRNEIYSDIETMLSAGGRGYVVLPLVEESEQVDLKAAVQVYEELQRRFDRYGVGLIHGRLPANEKMEVMTAFKEGKTHLLVATTVIEVGIDVPDANFLVIEEGDRFGLSQLHQLRGRIGRSGQLAYCFVLADPKTPEGRERLSVFATHLDGFVIAEKDLAIRGPGDLIGTQQHGFWTSLRAVDLIRDLDLMRAAHIEAKIAVKEGAPAIITEAITRRFSKTLSLLQV